MVDPRSGPLCVLLLSVIALALRGTRPSPSVPDLALDTALVLRTKLDDDCFRSHVYLPCLTTVSMPASGFDDSARCGPPSQSHPQRGQSSLPVSPQSHTAVGVGAC